MRKPIRMTFLAAALAGMASLPAFAGGPTFTVDFSSKNGLLASTSLTNPVKLNIVRPSGAAKPGEKPLLRLVYPDDGSNLASRINAAVQANDHVRAAITFTDASGGVPTTIILDDLTATGGWNDEDAEPSTDDGGLVQMRCGYGSFRMMSQADWFTYLAQDVAVSNSTGSGTNSTGVATGSTGSGTTVATTTSTLMP